MEGLTQASQTNEMQYLSDAFFVVRKNVNSFIFLLSRPEILYSKKFLSCDKLLGIYKESCL